MPGSSRLMLVLHAHLPFVRHPEFDAFLEENWLFEAITESYLPLLRMLRRLDAAEIPGALCLTLTPTLCAMLSDPVLLERYRRRLEGLCDLAGKEVVRTRQHAGEFHDAALHYQQRFEDMRRFFLEELSRDIPGAFRELAHKGRIEIFGCAATHALLPLLEGRHSVEAQILVGIESHLRFFGVRPKGFWIPECAYSPQVDELLAAHGVHYVVTDAHAVLHGVPRPRFGVYAPVRTPSGTVAFPRDPESSRQVWSAECGYPGDPLYREFYRDLGWDAPLEYVENYLVAHDLRHDLGLKYHRITGGVDLAGKASYAPQAALQKAQEHAGHFVQARLAHAAEIRQRVGRDPLFVAPYDAELFGHWWYEGPDFLEYVFREAAARGLELVTPATYLPVAPELQPQTPCVSSWGFNGYFENWLNGSNDWIYPPLHEAGVEMARLAKEHRHADGLMRRALNQAARELLLAQSSDWAFILSTNTMADYARRRVTGHLEHFQALGRMIAAGEVDTEYLQRLESRNNIFPDLDYRVYNRQ